MATEPYIYSKNYVTSDCTFVVSSGSAAFSNAYDRDPASQWVSSGANSDATTVTIQILFYEGSAAVSRTFDTLMLINHNWKDYQIQYWTGSVWSVFINQAADASLSSIANQYNVSTYGNTPTPAASFSPITTTQILISANSTQTANQEKTLGEIIVCNTQLAVANDLFDYNVQFRQKVKDIPLADGSLHRAVVRWSANRYEKYQSQVKLHLLSLSDKNRLLAIKQTGVPFLWYPEAITKPDELWYVHWSPARQYKYASYVKSAGFDIQMDLVEV